MRKYRPLWFALLYATVMLLSSWGAAIVLAQSEITDAGPPTPSRLQTDLWDLALGTGGFGFVTWLLSAGVFKLWKKRWGDPQNWVKVLVSVGVAVFVSAGAYVLGGLFHFWPVLPDVLYDIIRRTSEAVLGSKTIFGIMEGAQSGGSSSPPSDSAGVEPGTTTSDI